MKITTMFQLFIVCLCIFTKLLFCMAAEAPEPVVVGGKILRTGLPYHVVEADINGNMIAGKDYHGLSFGADANSPIEVLKGSTGKPMFFSPVNPKKGTLRVSTDFNVVFWDTTEVWMLRYDPITGQNLVSIGGVAGNPGLETLRNWFKLEKYGNAYKFMYCPTSVCPKCKDNIICKNVGVSVKDGKRLLGLSDEPFLVTFILHYD